MPKPIFLEIRRQFTVKDYFLGKKKKKKKKKNVISLSSAEFVQRVVKATSLNVSFTVFKVFLPCTRTNQPYGNYPILMYTNLSVKIAYFTYIYIGIY